MNKNPGIIGTKLGVTQIFGAKGEVTRCTVVQAGCVVVGKRTQEKDGYDALIVGLGDIKAKNTTKPVAGFFKKAGQEAKKTVRELRSTADHVAKFEIGQKIGVDQVFEEGQFVDAKGVSKGRGFSGVVRRHNFATSVSSHGTHEYFRHGGSIGTNMTPGRVLPGLKMPGQYGNKQISMLNVRIAKLVPEQDLVLIEGSVPGPTNGVVTIRGAVKKNGGKKKG